MNVFQIYSLLFKDCALIRAPRFCYYFFHIICVDIYFFCKLLYTFKIIAQINIQRMKVKSKILFIFRDF